MHVATRPGILNQINGRLATARRNNEVPTHIVVTEGEFKELLEVVPDLSVYSLFSRSPEQAKLIPLEVREFRVKPEFRNTPRHIGRPRIQVASEPVRLHDLPLYVVPDYVDPTS